MKVGASSKEPLLSVRGFARILATAELPLVLRESHLLVGDVDTVLGDGNVDASKIKFRITEILGGTLQSRPASDPDKWTQIVADGSNAYLEFTLAQLQGGLVAFFPDAAASTLTFKVQAADDGDPDVSSSPPHLSDSDPNDNQNDADPASISIPVVALKEIEAGQKGALNDDSPRGGLTPDTNTLQAWLAADNTLEIFVKLQGGKSGIVVLEEGVVEEVLSLSAGAPNITATWDAVNDRLSLQGDASATVGNFEAALAALQLQTVRFKEDSYRTISVRPNLSGDVPKKDFYVREVKVGASPPNPILVVDFDKSRPDSGQHFVLTEKHILVDDADTRDVDDNVDASKITLRITGLTGGELQSRSSSSESDWAEISLHGSNTYLEFTLADLKAGKISILAGNGIAKGDGGEGKKITFQVQAADAADNTANLSDSDPNDGEGDSDPLDAEIRIVLSAKVTAGEDGLINGDDVLTPDGATLNAWKQDASDHGGTLHVIVRLLDKQTGDALSLRTGYDASKFQPRWDATRGELSLEIGVGTTAADLQAALGFLEFGSEISSSASVRKVWVFPTLSGVVRYRVDEAAGLVRYYLLDRTDRSFSEASTEASGRVLFGKQGYLGVPLSDEGRRVYTSQGTSYDGIYLAISDDQSEGTTEGRWVITAGPRKGLLFWDRAGNRFGPGAEGSGWKEWAHFWNKAPAHDIWDNYAKAGQSRIYDTGSNSRKSISHHDLRLLDGFGFVRLLEVKESPVNPILEVDFSKFQATALRPLILTEAQILVDDPDTRDSNDPTKLDALKIKFRITEIVGGTLRSRLASDSDTWREIRLTAGTQYREFTLAQLQGGLVAFSPNAAASTLTFDIQAVDDGPNLSNAASVSVSVVALEEIEAGQKGALNDDGKLTPDTNTLQAWLTADNTLEIFVELQGGKSGIVVLEDGAVKESLSLSGSVSNITATWDTVNNRLSLQGSASATVGNFEAALRALQLQTVRFKDDSYRTISVEPNISGDVPKKDFYVREVKVGASPREPLLSVRGFGKISITAERNLVLSESHMLVDDVDTLLGDGNMDASNIKFRVTALLGGTLEKRASVSGSWSDPWAGSAPPYREFSLAELRGELVSLKASSGSPSLTFEVQAMDDGPNLSDAASVSIRVVPLKRLAAGRKGVLNDDGKLTPDDDALNEWLLADNTLRIFVELQGGKSGFFTDRNEIVALAAGVLQERLSLSSHSVASSEIGVSWDAGGGRLVLQGSSSATRPNFQEVLGALQLQTVHFGQASSRTILIRPDVSVSVARAAYYLREVEVGASPPNPVLEVRFDNVHADSEQHFVLTEENIFVYDPDTPDASLIEFRVTGLTGGTLEKHVSGSWDAMKKVTSQDYYAFTLAELRAGQIAIRAGDGLASGSGTKIVFRIQAADGGMPGVPSSPAHLSDSDPNDDDADPVTSEIPIIVTAKATAGIRSLLNADGVLTPNDPTLSSWKQTATTYRGILHVVAKLLDKRIGDVLSLRSGYDTSKVTFRWDGSKGELSMKFDSGASISEIKTALEFLELDTKVASSASTREVRIFPTLSVVRGFRHRFDETTGTVHYYVHDTVFQSFLLDGKIFARLVEIEGSPPNPVLRVDFSKLQTTSQSPLILSEAHIRVDDVDTRDSVDGTKVDGNGITFRVTGIAGAKLQERADAASRWTEIRLRGTLGARHQEFTLTQLRDGLVSLLPDAGVSTLTFRIQARDAGLPGTPGSPAHLSDSDYYDKENDADPVGVSIRVVPRKEIEAGKEMPVNDESADGALTPGDATLDAWISASTSSQLRALVELKGGKVGDTLFLEDGHGITTITSSWSWDEDTAIGTLSLQSDGTATPDHFQAMLNALALRTVRSASASVRTISVRPDVTVEVEKKDYYTRDVLVRKSHAAPYVGVQRIGAPLRFGKDDHAILPPSEFFVEDFDTSASNITIVMRNLISPAELHRSDGAGSYVRIMPESDGSLEFALDELQQGLIAIYLPAPSGKQIAFTLEAEDSDGNSNDIGRSNTYQKGARSFSFDAVLKLAPEKLEVDLQTGYQRAIPFDGLELVIERVRGKTSGEGVLRVVLENAVSGDRLLMRRSVSGVVGSWSDGGHRYTLTVSNSNTTSARIAEALEEIYYRARESVAEQTRELVVSWVDGTNTETVLFISPLANRPPVLRNWGIAARYHDIALATGETETPLDLGYHPYPEYMPEILDNEGEVVRLEIVLADKAGGDALCR